MTIAAATYCACDATQAEAHLPGAVLSVAGGPAGHIAVSAGATLYCLQLRPGADAPAALASLERVASVRLRHCVTGLAWDGATLVACDSHDGAHTLLFDATLSRPLELLASERSERRAAGIACTHGCAGGIDRDGFFFSFSTAAPAADEDSPAEAHCLPVTACFRLGCVPTSIRTAASGDAAAFTASTLLGGVAVVSPLDAEHFAVLADAEARAATHPLTAPLLGCDHAAARGGPPASRRVLDGDLLRQLLFLPAAAQREVLSHGLAEQLTDEEVSRQLDDIEAATRLTC